ncbi:putative diguanylate cyclase [Kluyvera cryocrescens]|uniref:Putative diguanylate cyclase n=1 Tax=Kluyvera cryocrescens TaxID=580 RepID=A0A485AMB0_KLUCR|nr:putative diguanylate cyclase [Kluyvera cryocrescens]
MRKKHVDTQEEYLFTLNISAVQLNDVDFAFHALAIVTRLKLCTAQLVFEITQSAVPLTEAARENLQMLQEAGINIAWDGIGSLEASANGWRSGSLIILSSIVVAWATASRR